MVGMESIHLLTRESP